MHYLPAVSIGTKIAETEHAIRECVGNLRKTEEAIGMFRDTLRGLSSHDRKVRFCEKMIATYTHKESKKHNAAPCTHRL